MFILGLQGSPRKGGNTDTFMAAFMDRAAQTGARVETIQVARAGIVPCLGCGHCERHGTCVIADDPMSLKIYGLLREADLVVAASPVYFYGISAQLKILVDRCQTLWSRKYIYRLKDPLAATRKGLLFSVAASRGRQLFDGVELTGKYFFDAIDAGYAGSLTYRGIEAKGAVRQREGLGADIDGLIRTAVRPQGGRRRILFVSPRGACRAPMAAAMAQLRGGDRLRTDFAGRSPAAALPVSMVQTMQRNGIDVAYQRTKPIDQAFHGAAPDLVVAIDDPGDGRTVHEGRALQWKLTAPETASDNAMDDLYRRIDTWIGDHLPLMASPPRNATKENQMAEPHEMYQCQTVNCGYIYNPDKGDRKGKVPKGTAFADLPDDWKCPICGAGKKMFKPLG